MSKFSNETGNRLWSRYIGGVGSEHSGSFNPIAVTANGVYVTGSIGSDEEIATTGAYQIDRGVGNQSFLVKLNHSGDVLWGTYLYQYNENYSTPGIAASLSSGSAIFPDAEGNIYVTGLTDLLIGVSTSGAFMETLYPTEDDDVHNIYDRDAYIFKFNALGEKLWRSYFGGELGESTPWVLPYNNSFYVVGSTSSTENIDTLGSDYVRGGQYITKFSPNDEDLNIQEVSELSFAIYPNPTLNTLHVTTFRKMQIYTTLKIYNILGQELFKTTLNPFKTTHKIDYLN